MPKRKKAAVKIRRKWAINPRTRVKESKKIYSRKREKTKLRKLMRKQNEA